MRRAIERSNLLVAEMTLREIGRPSNSELVQLTALICQKQRERRRRVAARFLERPVASAVGITIDEVALIASLLAALGGPRHDQALSALLDMTETASGARGSGDLGSV